MNVLGSADETDRSHAVAPVVVRSLCCIDQSLVVAKAKIVVRAHVDDLPAILQLYAGALGGSDRCFSLKQAGFPDVLHFFRINT